MKSVRAFGAVLFALAFLLASCFQSQGAAIKVNDAWSRPGPAGGNSANYFVIDNPAGQEDNLIKAESGSAQAVELHMSSMDAEGTMSMQPQAKVNIPAGQKVEFKPGGLHVMLINLQADLKPGDKVNATLTFEKAGNITIEAEVREP